PRAGVHVQRLAAVFLRQQVALVEAHARRRTPVRAQQLGHYTRLFFVPVGLALAAGVVTIVAPGHDVADPRLVVAVVVVVADEHGAEAVGAGLVLVAEIVGQQLQVLAVQVAAPVGAGPAVGTVASPGAALLVHQALYALVADGEVKLVVRSDEQAVHA